MSFNVRIQNKYDTLENWLSSSLVLKAGEIALATVATESTAEGKGQYIPTVLMKVGDGTKTFAQLPWTAARAADVYAWAKLENPTIDQLPGNLKTAITDLQNASSTGVESKIKAAIEGLDVDDTAEAGKFVTAVSEADGKITVTRAALQASDIPTLAIEKIEGLQTALGNKLETSAFNTFKEENTTAIADAKKAGTDAAAALETYKTSNDSALAAVKATADAAATQTALGEEITRAKAAEKANADAITAIKDGKDMDSFADVEAKFATIDSTLNDLDDTYATEAEAQGYADAAKAAVIGAEGDAKTANTVYGAKAYAADIASSEADAAQAAAEATAAADATTKANQALADAKTYGNETFATIANLDKYALTYDSDERKIYLTDEAGAKQGAGVDASAFIKDGMLSDVEYNAVNNTLTFTWNTDAGESKTDTVVLSDILDPYVAVNTNTINMTIEGTNISAEIVSESIDEGHLVPSLKETINAAATEADLTLAKNRITALEGLVGEGGKVKNAEHADSATTADTATSVAANGVDTAAIADGAVTAAKLGADVDAHIQGVKVNNATHADSANAATHADAATKVDNALAIKVSETETVSFDGSVAKNIDLSGYASKTELADAINALDSSVSASAEADNKLSVLTGITQTDGKLTDKTEVQLAAVAKTGKINDLTQTEDTVIVFNCGTASTVI